MTDKTGAKVVVKSAQGAYIGGVLGAIAPNGNLFVLKDEVCLDVDFASDVGAWEVLSKREHWCGKGKIVDDPREK
jgi:hypothetical protein